jgi:hypothetical protein
VDTVPNLSRTSRTLRHVSIASAVVIGFLVVALVVALMTRTTTTTRTTPKYDPLGDFPTQTVTSDQPIPVGHDVGINATQCVNAAHVVKLTGDTRWVTVDPAGSSFTGNHGQGERSPGCHLLHFENPMPVAVIVRVNQLAAQGIHITTWVIEGTATPIAPNGERPVTRAYRTDNFRIAA